MTPTLEEANTALRSAVSERLDATPADDPKMRGYIRGPSAAEVLARFAAAGAAVKGDDAMALHGDGILRATEVHPTSQAFYDLCDRLKEMHRMKSTDYGCPSGTDPLANIRNGAKFVGIPAWRAAMVRLSDKVTRLATFNATGSLTFEGVEDNLFDLASYALLSLLLYQEESSGAAD